MICLMFVEQRRLVYLKVKTGVLLKWAFCFCEMRPVSFISSIYIIQGDVLLKREEVFVLFLY
ncbi:hypothetical protein D5066_05255 [Enterobacter chuandaensis]|nr:hypothetical protein D5066_05255 [Enterobacter chuandaensis]